MKNLTAEDLIRICALRPHPEGGFYRETYRSAARSGDRNCCTAIYFLLPAGAKSRLHRLNSDEIWHHYLGGPVTIAQLFPDGQEERVVLGPDILSGQVQQHVVPAGCWFGAWLEPGSKFSFVGCTVAPGFDFEDFEIGGRPALLKEFPASAEVIRKLT